MLGTFTGDGVLRVRHGDQVVLELDTQFLHDGRPQRDDDGGAAPSPTQRCGAGRARSRGDAAGSARPSRTSRRRRRSSAATTTRSGAPPSCVRWSACGSDSPADGVVLAEPGARRGHRDRHRRQPVVRGRRSRAHGPRRGRRGDPQRGRRRRRPRRGRADGQLLVGRPAPADDARRSGRGGRGVLRGIAGAPRAVRQRQGLAEQRVPRRRRRAPQRSADAGHHRRRPRPRRRRSRHARPQAQPATCWC